MDKSLTELYFNKIEVHKEAFDMVREVIPLCETFMLAFIVQLQLQLDTARPRTRGLCAGTGGGGVC